MFALDNSELGGTDVVQHGIDTGDHASVQQQPYRTPIIRHEKMTAMIGEMKEQGIVKPSASLRASPVVLVDKGDGSLRFCIDFTDG